MQSAYDFCTTDTSAWYDSDRTKTELNLGPTSKKACPCDICPQADYCASKAVICKAFDNWSATGTYFAKQIGKNFIPA